VGVGCRKQLFVPKKQALRRRPEIVSALAGARVALRDPRVTLAPKGKSLARQDKRRFRTIPHNAVGRRVFPGARPSLLFLYKKIQISG
jgi:hypothetical protein